MGWIAGTARLALVGGAVGAWFWTQSLIRRREAPSGAIDDVVHRWTGGWNRWLHHHPRATEAVLVLSSLGIDAAALALLGSAVFGRSLRPFLGLVIVFALRQLCQGLARLPVPPGAIWRRPRVPSLLVTYGVTNDLFFSGHTAVSVLAAIEAARVLAGGAAALVAALALAEAATVLVLRAHYTMDVFTGAVTAALAAGVAGALAPILDRLLAAAC